MRNVCKKGKIPVCECVNSVNTVMLWIRFCTLTKSYCYNYKLNDKNSERFRFSNDFLHKIAPHVKFVCVSSLWFFFLFRKFSCTASLLFSVRRNLLRQLLVVSFITSISVKIAQLVGFFLHMDLSDALTKICDSNEYCFDIYPSPLTTPVLTFRVHSRKTLFFVEGSHVSVGETNTVTLIVIRKLKIQNFVFPFAKRYTTEFSAAYFNK